MYPTTISEQIDGRQLKAWIDAGEVIEPRESDRVVVQFIPKTQTDRPKETVPSAVKFPNFEVRRRKSLGDRVFNAVDDFLEYRHERY